jgi:hypothetical protein
MIIYSISKNPLSRWIQLQQNKDWRVEGQKMWKDKEVV